MKLKAALVMTLLVLTSLLSFSNRCGKTCDGRTMMTATAAVSATATAIISCSPDDDKKAEKIELAEASPLLRMTIAL